MILGDRGVIGSGDSRGILEWGVGIGRRGGVGVRMLRRGMLCFG